MKSILDPSFRYTNAASTDLRKTFARIRRQQKAEQLKAAEQTITPRLIWPNYPHDRGVRVKQNGKA